MSDGTEDKSGASAELSRLRAENAELARSLADSKRRVEELTRLVSVVPGIVWYCEGVPGERDARATFVSDTAEHMLGYARELWLANTNFYESLIHPDDRAKVLARLTRHSGGRTAEHRLMHANGDAVWVELYAQFIRDEDGSPIGTCCVVLDVGPRMRSEQGRADLLERSFEMTGRLDDLIASVPGAVWEVALRADTGIAQVNFVSDQITLMTGHLPEDLLADVARWRALVHPDDIERLEREMEASYRTGSGVIQHRWMTKDGNTLSVDSYIRVLRDAKGAVCGARGVTIDVTARKNAEEERVRLTNEVIRMQAATVLELSTPLIPISDQILVMPLIGTVDKARADRILETLLQGIASSRARFAILDITGVPSVDAPVADALLRAAAAVRLLGAEIVLSGIRPEVAITIVALETDLRRVVTCASLKSGIAYATRQQRGAR